MPLADFQAALGSVIATATTSKSPQFSGLDLSLKEAQWLESLTETPGFQVTCAIQRWWRETRLRDLARLTIAALGKDSAARVIAIYLQRHICTSLFFLPETLAFLRFVADHTDHPHLSAIAQFESALLLTKEESMHPTSSLQPTVRYVEFAAPPEELLTALLQGLPLPEPSLQRYRVRVSAALPHFWELAMA
jgi:hypothetical protein